MSEQTQTQGLNRTVKAPPRTRKYDNSQQAPLSSYLMQGAGGMGFMMFIFWLAGFGS
jgi:hypothetical protein